ncbi:MAG TPA: DUF1203 domain-containing protein [Mycobacteriales bacterium]|nr:DUF1203 domain-containing protein [Mycobacteriales bacterium]
MPFTVTPIPPGVVADLLVRDDAGRPPKLLVDREGGSPLRCCLRPIRPGEEVALVSYAPLRRWAASRGIDPAAYDEVGPVFVHAGHCAGADGTGWPSELREGPRVLRAYTARGRILRGVQVPSYGEFEKELEQLLADPAVAVVHARSVEFGCFTFAVSPG